MSETTNRSLRDALGQFATGVAIVTTLDDKGDGLGMTVNSFNSVSLDPPLVLWSLAATSYGYAQYRKARHFCVNVLAADQLELARRFSKASRNKFEDVGLRTGLGGVPIVEGCVAAFECKRVAHYPGGDHMIVIGRVERFEATDRSPLLFHAGRYLAISASPGDREEGKLAAYVQRRFAGE